MKLKIKVLVHGIATESQNNFIGSLLIPALTPLKDLGAVHKVDLVTQYRKELNLSTENRQSLGV